MNKAEQCDQWSRDGLKRCTFVISKWELWKWQDKFILDWAKWLLGGMEGIKSTRKGKTWKDISNIYS